MAAKTIGHRQWKTGADLLDSHEAAECQERLASFVADGFGPGMNRPCQVTHAFDYIRGLLLSGRRKSMQPIASRLHISYDEIQNFITDSTWQWRPIFHWVAQKAVAELGDLAAYVIDGSGQRKQGKCSPGAGRQHLGSYGSIQNCQTFVSMLAASATDWASINCRLFLPEHWGADTTDPEQLRRRRAARIPDGVTHVPKWRLSLDMLSEGLRWGLPRRPVLADSEYGKVGEYRGALRELKLDYVVEGTFRMIARRASEPLVRLPQPPGPGGRTKPKYQSNPQSLKALAAGQEFVDLPGVGGTWYFERVRPCGRGVKRLEDRSYPEEWLIVWNRPDGKTKYFLSNMLAASELTLAKLAALRWTIECGYREGKQVLGLDHFEGRTYPGWMHHITLHTLAHLFVLLEALAQDDGHTHPTIYGVIDDSQPAFLHDCPCPTCGRHYPKFATLDLAFIFTRLFALTRAGP